MRVSGKRVRAPFSRGVILIEAGDAAVERIQLLREALIVMAPRFVLLSRYDFLHHHFCGSLSAFQCLR